MGLPVEQAFRVFTGEFTAWRPTLIAELDGPGIPTLAARMQA